MKVFVFILTFPPGSSLRVPQLLGCLGHGIGDWRWVACCVHIVSNLVDCAVHAIVTFSLNPLLHVSQHLHETIYFDVECSLIGLYVLRTSNSVPRDKDSAVSVLNCVIVGLNQINCLLKELPSSV